MIEVRTARLSPADDDIADDGIHVYPLDISLDIEGEEIMCDWQDGDVW